MYPPIHQKPPNDYGYDRLNKLWKRYDKYHEMTVFSSLEDLLSEHESYQDGFEDVREEYIEKQYDRFLVQLSLSDLPYRYATKSLIEEAEPVSQNRYVKAFLDQFDGFDTDHKALFLFPESYVSQFFVVSEVCKRAEAFYPIRNLFPDEETVHFLAVFDKRAIDDVMLMFHLLYANTSQELFGGYSLYDYSFQWYQTHLWEDDIVLRSPYLPDRIAKYQGSLPFCYNPVKTVYVRRNIEHILECGYFSSELEFFLCLTREIMPIFQWWYQDIALYEEKDRIQTNWRLERTKIRTRLTAEGVIKPKWKQELTLFHVIRKHFPDTLYQYRSEWLGRQSLDLYIPSLQTGIEYQGVQHYRSIDFFGGEEGYNQRQELDLKKKLLCQEHSVRLVEWPYDTEPTDENIRKLLSTILIIPAEV
ncbi:MAG: hypothetical protein IJM83_03500 [Firmicutes bacterium]|nr:hypothetical protein [Bacillota bacterium]